MNDRSRRTDLSSRRAPLGAVPTTDDQDAWIAWVEAHPITQLLGMRCLSVERGRLRMIAHDSWWPLNPNGAFHGGMVLAYADQCLGLASMTAVAPGCFPATATLNAEYVRPSLPPLTYDVRVERSGRSLVYLVIDVLDRDCRLSAKINATMATTGNGHIPVTP